MSSADEYDDADTDSPADGTLGAVAMGGELDTDEKLFGAIFAITLISGEALDGPFGFACDCAWACGVGGHSLLEEGEGCGSVA